MISDFFTKPLGGAKFRRLRNIIMNVDFDEQGKVEMDAIMQIHQQKMSRRADADTLANNNISKNEPTVSSGNRGIKHARSQECVGNKYRKSNQSWAIARKAHVRSNPTRTYAKVVSE